MFARERFTEREAWQWLISEASFKARVKRVGSAVINLARGQLAASLRFMAEAWQWEHTRVRRFLGRLKTATMIEHETQQGVTVITICNYDKYQRVSLPYATPIETQNATATQQQRNKLEDNKNTEVDIRGDRASASLFTEGSKALADAFWRSLGITHKLQIPPELAGADWRALEWERAGWTEDIITAAIGRIGPGKPISYYEKVFASDFAKRQAPLPIVEIREAEKLTVNRHGASNSQSGSLLASIKRELAELEAEESTDLALPSGDILSLSDRSIR